MPKLSIIIPCYNEAATIRTLLDRVAAAPLPIGREIIVVDDGSTDDSRAQVEQWLATAPLGPEDEARLLSKTNGGKGSAVRTGVVASTGDIVIIQDADLEYDPGDYAACIAPILAGRARVVYGSRERFGGNRRHSALSFYVGGLTVTYWMNLLFGATMTDEPTCYKTFDGPLIRALGFRGRKFDWEPEVTAKLLRLGYQIHEVPIRYYPRKISEGKKIRWRDGVQALWTALLWRCLPLGAERRRLLALPGEAARQRQERLEARWLWGLVGVALALRVLLAWPALRDPLALLSRPDSPTYLDPALALVEHGSYSADLAATAPATLRPPGYPVTLAVLLGVSGGSWTFVALVFCALGALIVIPVYHAGRLLGGPPAGLIAGALVALNPTAIGAAPLFLSDTLFAFLAAWQLVFFLRFWQRERLVDYWASVGLNALAALVRSAALPWLAPALFLILVFPRKSWTKRWLGAAGALVLTALVLTPWLWRNDRAGAGWTLDTNVGNTLYFHNAAALLAVVEGGSAAERRAQWQEATDAEFAAHPDRYPDERAREAYKCAQALAVIRQHPWTYLRLHVRPYVLLPDMPALLENLGLAQAGRGTFDVLNRDGLVAAARHYFGGQWGLLALVFPLALVALATYLGALLELGRWLLTRQWYLGALFLAFVAYYLVLPGPVAMPRYHLPALPLLAAMAGAAVVAAWSRCRAGASAPAPAGPTPPERS